MKHLPILIHCFYSLSIIEDVLCTGEKCKPCDFASSHTIALKMVVSVSLIYPAMLSKFYPCAVIYLERSAVQCVILSEGGGIFWELGGHNNSVLECTDFFLFFATLVALHLTPVSE